MNAREFCFWLKGYLDADQESFNTQKIRDMLSHVTKEDTDPVVIGFVRELKRFFSPVFGYAGELPRECFPGIAKALDEALGVGLPKTNVTVTRSKASGYSNEYQRP
jgi:hypothetical protein